MIETRSFDDGVFPDLGIKTINRLLSERFSQIFIDQKEVPVRFQADSAGNHREEFPSIYMEFIDITPAEDRQFSDILEVEYNQLSDGSYADSALIDYPQAYYVTYDVHLYAETFDNIVDLVTEMAKRLPSQGFQFEIQRGNRIYNLAVQRPQAPLNADVKEDNYYHRIYTYRVESYIFDESTARTVPTVDTVNGDAKVNVDLEVKHDED